MDNKFLIGDHLVQICFEVTNGCEDEWLASYFPFKTQKDDEPLLKMTVTSQQAFTEKRAEIGQFDCGGHNFGVYRSQDGAYQFEISNERGVLCGLLYASPDFRNCLLSFVGTVSEECQFALNNALMITYAFASAPYRTVLMHASVVRHDGYGYLFLGRSGTGKSTHSRLWLKHIPSTELMNDDNPVVRVVDGTVKVYGSPWSGKTPCYRNVVAPAGGFVQLEQRPENTIRRESVLESFASLLPSVSSMKWDKPIYMAICDTISDIIRLVPVYHLGCLPDEEAARLSYSTLKRQV